MKCAYHLDLLRKPGNLYNKTIKIYCQNLERIKKKKKEYVTYKIILCIHNKTHSTSTEELYISNSTASL